MGKLFRLAPALLAACLPAGAAADVIVLKNGNEIQGEIVEETPQRLTVRFIGGTLTINRRDVAGVRRETRLQYLLEQGESWLRRDHPENAIAIYQEALQEDSSSEKALQGLLTARERHAEALRATGYLEEALEAYRVILDLAPGHPGAAEGLEKIRSSLRAADLDEAAGKEALRRGAVEEAAARLRGLYDRFPARRSRVAPSLARSLIATGDGLLQAGRYEEAESRYLEAVSIEPDLVPAMTFQFAFARWSRLVPLVDRGEFQLLLQKAEEGLRIVPESEPLTFLAAVALEGLGKKPEAARAYRKIAGEERVRETGKSLDALRQAAEAKIAGSGAPKPAVDPRREEVLGGGFTETETEHFLVRHRNNLIAREVAQAAEEAYARLFQELGCQVHWVKRCAIVLYPTQEEFQEKTGHNPWTGGAHRISHRLGILADHQIFSWQLQPRLTGAVIPHEVAHAMLAHRIGYRHRIPLWFNEGFAIYWEPQYVHRHYRRIATHAARTRALYPLEKLVGLETYPSDDEEVKLFYAHSFSLVDLFLDTMDLPDLIKFAIDLTSGADSLENLLERHYRIHGLKALESRLLARLRE